MAFGGSVCGSKVGAKPAGPFELGMLRTRLPAASGSTPGLLAQVHYPGDAKQPLLPSAEHEYFRPAVAWELADQYKVPRWLVRRLLVGRWRQLDKALAPQRAAAVGWPLIVFSSGLFGCCEMYTQFCRDLASRGAIVLALEHEDGSGIFALDGVTGEKIPYKTPPFDNPTGEQIRDFRRPFLEQRAEALAASIEAIKAAAACAIKPASVATDAEALASVLGGADLNSALHVGHSFGAASVVHHLASLGGREPFFAGAAVLDLWGRSLPLEHRGAKLPVPFVQLLSEEFVRDGLAKASQVLAAANMGGCLATAFLPGTRHQWISESHNWLPQPLARRAMIQGSRPHPQSFHETADVVWSCLQRLLLAGAAGGIHGSNAEQELAQAISRAGFTHLPPAKL